MGKAIRRAFESCQRITLLTDVPAHRRRGRGDGFGAKLVELPRQRFSSWPRNAASMID